MFLTAQILHGGILLLPPGIAPQAALILLEDLSVMDIIKPVNVCKFALTPNLVLLSAQCLYVYIFAKREQQECLVILTQILVCRSALHHTLEIQLAIELVLRSVLMGILPKIAQMVLYLILEYVCKYALMDGATTKPELVSGHPMNAKMVYLDTKPIINA